MKTDGREHWYRVPEDGKKKCGGRVYTASKLIFNTADVSCASGCHAEETVRVWCAFVEHENILEACSLPG